MKKCFYLANLLVACFLFNSLTVKAQVPVITDTPATQTVCTGNNVSFIIHTDITPTSYMWYVLADTIGATMTPISGEISQSLTVLATFSINGYKYACKAVNGTDTSILSATATLTVDTPLTIASILGSTAVCIGSHITLADATPAGVWSNSDNTIDSISSTGVVRGNAVGTDNITYTVSNTCGSYSATTQITVNTTLVIDPITGPVSVCVGSTITLNDASPSGTWSSLNSLVDTVNSAGIVTGVAAGFDTVSYTITNMCGNTVATFPISIDTAGVANIFGRTGICVGTPDTLRNVTPFGTWSNLYPTVDSIDATGIVYGISAGLDTISYTVINACGTYTASKHIIVSTGIPVLASITGPSSVCSGSTITFTDSISGGKWSVLHKPIDTINNVGELFGKTAGIDTVVYSKTNACGTNKVFKQITVNVMPAPIVGPWKICQGSTATLSDSITGGTWRSFDTNIVKITNTGVITGISADTSSVRYRMPGGCTVRLHIQVDSVPKPIIGSLVVCNGLTTTLSDSSTDGSWFYYTNGIVKIDTNGVVTGLSAGTDSVFYQYANSCNSFVIVTVNPTPGAISGADSVCMGSSVTFSDSTIGGTWASNDTLGVTITELITIPQIDARQITGDSAGNYVITYTSLNGCSISKNLTVKFVPVIPVISVSPFSDTMCANTMYQNFGAYPVPSTGVHYAWSATNAEVWAQGTGKQYSIVNFNASGNSVITLTTTYDGNNCVSNATYNALIDTYVSNTVAVIYYGGNFYCIDSSAISYQWGYDNVDTLNPHTLDFETSSTYMNDNPDFDNNLYWVVTSEGGCFQKTYFNSPTKIANKISTTNNMVIYPNPITNGSLTVELPVASNRVEVIVKDVFGKLVSSTEVGTVNNKKIPVSLHNIAPGTYFVKVVTEAATYTDKVEVK